jgi:hypothetical protein
VLTLLVVVNWLLIALAMSSAQDFKYSKQSLGSKYSACNYLIIFCKTIFALYIFRFYRQPTQSQFEMDYLQSLADKEQKAFEKGFANFMLDLEAKKLFSKKKY